MSRGRKSTIISIRLEDSIVITLWERAKKTGCNTVGEYIKKQILKSLSVNTIKFDESSADSVNTMVPLYNPRIHKPGDTVRVVKYGKETVVVVPELDADGNVVTGI